MGAIKVCVQGNIWFFSEKSSDKNKAIAADKAIPLQIISYELSLDGAPNAYKHFDNGEKGWTKIILKPGMKSFPKSALGKKPN